MHISFQVLRYFLAIAQTESITAACDVLHVTQPTVSRQIGDLEKEIGVKLFDRGPRRITLTREGVLFRRRAEEILSLLDRTEKELSGSHRTIEGAISIAAGELRATRYLASLMREFHDRHPAVTFTLRTLTSDVIHEEMDKGLIDLGLMLEPIESLSYDFIRFARKEKWGAILSKGHPLSQKPLLRPEDVRNSSVILPARPHTINEMRNWLGSVYPSLQSVHHSNLISSAITMAEAGLGIAFAVVTEELEASDTLKVLPIEPAITSGTLLVWKKNQPLNPASEAFVHFVRTHELAHGEAKD